MIDLTSILVSVIAIIISIVSVYYYKTQAGIMNKQADIMKTQTDTAEKTLELYREELNSANEHFLMEEKRKHYRKLIISMQSWQYNPCSEGEMITSSVNTNIWGSQSSINLISGKYPVRYLEQAKSHLKGYEEIWKLYEEAPRICQQQEQQNQEFKDYLESKLKDEIEGKGIKVVLSDRKRLLGIAHDYILGNIHKEPENREDFQPPYTVGDNIVVIAGQGVGQGLNKITDMENAIKLTAVLNQLLDDSIATEKAKAFQKSTKAIGQNKEQFERLLKETIESVELSLYRKMKGQCDDCPIFITKELNPST